MQRASKEQDKSRAESHPRRPVRSFVLRAGRLTDGQRRALEELWPKYGLEEVDETLDFEAEFGNRNPVVVEIGFGNGDATWRMAQQEPDKNFLGIEVHRPGVGHLLLMLKQHELRNVRVACTDAVEFLQRRVADSTLDGVRIYFPDPWPKKRHHKRRIVQQPFIELLAQRLRPGGIFHLATDWAPYAEWMVDVMSRFPEFENTAKTGDFCPRPGWRPATKYERRGERLGHDVFDLVYRLREQD